MLKTRRRERILLNACLEAKQPFVVDNTNVTREARAEYISQAKASRFSVVGYYFKSALQPPSSETISEAVRLGFRSRELSPHIGSLNCRVMTKALTGCFMWRSETMARLL